MRKGNYKSKGNGVKAGNYSIGGGSSYSSAYSGGSYFSKSADLNIPYRDNSRVRLGDLARRLLGNSRYGLYGRYGLRPTGKSFYNEKADAKPMEEPVKCPRCGHKFFSYKSRGC